MYKLKFTHQFKKSLRLCVKRGLDIQKMQDALKLLENTGTLPSEYLPHPLCGRWANHMEAHIEPDWLIVWRKYETELVLNLVDTGTHSDLFK